MTRRRRLEAVLRKGLALLRSHGIPVARRLAGEAHSQGARIARQALERPRPSLRLPRPAGIREAVGHVSESLFQTDAPRSFLPRELRGAPRDIGILVGMSGLLALGLLMIYSATSITAAHPASHVQSQAVKILLGLMGFLVASRVDYHVWCRWAPVLYLLGLGALVLVVIPGLGHTAGHSRRWLTLGGMTLQPADFARAGLVVYLAFLLAKPKTRLERWSTGMVPCLLALGPVVLLVLAQPNLSTALALVCVTGLLLVAGGIPRRHLLVVGGVGLGLLPFVLRGYQSTRLANWSAYWFQGGELRGGNYQMDQSILAIGSGGVFGRGLGGSHQKWFFLPDAHTDFVFAIVGEELGLMGTLFTIAMVLLLVMRGLETARRAPDRFGFLLAVGIAGSIAIYAGTNLMVATGLFPTTGLPLPLVSYGGTAVLTLLFSLGVLTNIAAQGDSKLLVGIGDHDG